MQESSVSVQHNFCTIFLSVPLGEKLVIVKWSVGIEEGEKWEKNVQKKYFPDFYRTRCECTQEFKKIYENSAIDFLITFECKSMQVKVIVEMKISRVNNASWIIYFSNNFLKDSCSKTSIPEMLVHFSSLLQYFSNERAISQHPAQTH